MDDRVGAGSRRTHPRVPSSRPELRCRGIFRRLVRFPHKAQGVLPHRLSTRFFTACGWLMTSYLQLPIKMNGAQ
jgi:hypothetical protein